MLTPQKKESKRMMRMRNNNILRKPLKKINTPSADNNHRIIIRPIISRKGEPSLVAIHIRNAMTNISNMLSEPLNK